MQIKQLIQKLTQYQVIIEAEVNLNGDAKIKPESEGIAAIVDGLNELSKVAEQKLSAEKEKVAAQITENLRKHTRLMLDNESRSVLNEDYYNTIFQAQIWLAANRPVNAKDPDTGLYACPFFNQDDFAFGGADIIAVPSGHLFNKEDLSNYYGRNNAFVMKNGVFQVHDPYGNILTEREIAYMQANGVNIPRPDQNLLAMNRAFGLGGQPIDGRENAVENPAQPQEERRGALQMALSAATLRGALAGISLGAAVGSVISWIPFILFPPLPLWGLGALILGSTLAGMAEASKGRSALEVFVSSLTANFLLITVASFLAPQMIGLLGAYSIISSAVAASAIASIPIGLSCFPIASLMVGLIRDQFNPEGLRDFYKHLALVSFYVPMVVFGVIGATTGFLMGAISNLIRGPAPIVREMNRDPVENLLEDNPLLIEPANQDPARIYRRLGMNQEHLRAGRGVEEVVVADPAPEAGAGADLDYRRLEMNRENVRAGRRVEGVVAVDPAPKARVGADLDAEVAAIEAACHNNAIGEGRDHRLGISPPGIR